MKSIFKTFVLSLLVIAQMHFAYAQTASILPPAKTTFIDQNGKPLTSGTVDFYIPGTTTRKATWQDAGQTILNSNPVVLDAAGRALILGTGSYRQIVKDRNNNIVWDQITAQGGGGSGGGGIGDGNQPGAIIPWAGLVPPNNYAFTYGQELSRATYSVLYGNITLVQNVTCGSGSPTLTSISDTSQLNIGAYIEGSCIPAGTIVISKTASTVVMSANALVTTTISARFFPWGNGNGTTTFNVPDLRGVVLPGRNNMGGAAGALISNPTYNDPNSINGFGGSQTSSLTTQAMLPAVNFVVSGSAPGASNNVDVVRGSASSVTGGGGVAGVGAASFSQIATTTTLTGAGVVASSGGSSAPFRTVQPSRTINYVIKLLPDTNLSIARCADLSDAGTACTYNVGTSGATVPLLNAANSFTNTQTFSSVSIASGSVTGLTAPTNPTDAATKFYVDSIATGLIVLPPSLLATTGVLPNAPTYANGALGVGATLTSGVNSTLTVDSTVAALGNVILVKNQASAFQNGIYTVTQAGSGGAPWILTRATYFDQAADMSVGSYTLVTGGATLSNSSYTLAASVVTVGTDAVTWNLFSSVGVSSIQGNVGAFTLSSGIQNQINDIKLEQIIPGGRLTLASATPYMQASQTAKTEIYFAPIGSGSKYIPLYTSGIGMRLFPFTSSDTDNVGPTINLAASASWAASSNYDVYAYLNGTQASICTGPDWSAGAVAGSNAVGTSVRGTGAGSTEHQMFKGFQTNRNAMTCRTGAASTIACAANECTYLGYFRTTTQGTSTFTYGGAGAASTLYVYNAFNQTNVCASAADVPGTWTYTSATIRQANGSATNQINFLQEGSNSVKIDSLMTANITNVIGAYYRTGVSLNSTTTFDKNSQTTNAAAATFTASQTVPNVYNNTFGPNYVSVNESSDGANTAIGVGGTLMSLTACMWM